MASKGARKELTPFLRVTWTDSVTGAKGYVMIDRLVGRMATGVTRMRVGCTLEEVEDLARGMSYKTGVLNLPVGEAKGSIDHDPFADGAREVLGRLVKAVRPLLDQYWVTAEDLGVPQALLDAVFDEAGLEMSLHAALVRSENPDPLKDPGGLYQRGRGNSYARRHRRVRGGRGGVRGDRRVRLGTCGDPGDGTGLRLYGRL